MIELQNNDISSDERELVNGKKIIERQWSPDSQD